MPLPPIEQLSFPQALRVPLEPYLPPPTTSRASQPRPRPFVTLTYAASLDSVISLSPGTPTPLSGPASKAMTHYLRTRHDAILVGAGTANADDPGLNSRLSDVSPAEPLALQPRPVVVDRRAEWVVNEESRVLVTARAGRGKGPWVIISRQAEATLPQERRTAVEACGGAYIVAESWHHILQELASRSITSVMVEGGATVINRLLSEPSSRASIDSFILTIAPTFLGQGGVQVSPQRGSADRPAVRFTDVHWLPLEQDVVMCARVAS